MRDILTQLIERQKELEEGIIPFVEPNSTQEDLAFNELFFVKRQINVVMGSLLIKKI